MNQSMPIVDEAKAGSPDCLKCLRKKLQADGAVVFVKIQDGWALGNFEADTPREDAEFKFQHMLKINLPGIVSGAAEGLSVTGDDSLQSTFPGINQLFAGASIVAAPVHYGTMNGIRFAWRDAASPFSAQDLETLRCFSECPPGCC